MRLVIAVVAICLAVLFLSPLLIPLITEMEVVTEKIECVAGNETLFTPKFTPKTPHNHD